MIESGNKINREKNLIDISQREKTYSYEPKVREKEN